MKEILSRFIPQNFNDSLALVLIVGIVVLWVVQATTSLSIPSEVTGALIVTWTLIVQFYFRKSKTEA